MKVFDQVGLPKLARFIAETTLCGFKAIGYKKMLGTFSSWLYCLTALDSTRWHGFANVVLDITKDKRCLYLNVK